VHTTSETDNGSVVVAGELQQVAAVGAPGVRGGVGQVGEEFVDVPGKRVRGSEVFAYQWVHAHRP
jgi:hypothetical protein